MSRVATRAAPLRFLIGVVFVWVAARGAMVAGWQPDRERHWGPLPGSLLDAMPVAALPIVSGPLPLAVRAVARLRAAMTPASPPLDTAPAGPARSGAPLSGDEMRLISLASYAPGASRYWSHGEGSEAAAAIATPPSLPPGPSEQSRLSGSAWAFVRGGGGTSGVSPDGQLGGSQAGMRILYRVAGTLSASARLSRALAGPRQTEAAVGIDWQPVRTFPVHLMLDRRIAIDSGGRDAWAAGAAGGAYDVPVAAKARLDGYAQAGVVGARSRDLYADGAVRVGREIMFGEGRSLTVGGGAWGAAQPGVARLDTGPSAVLRIPVEHATLAAALDWRERVAGDARPGSGPALTVGVDF